MKAVDKEGKTSIRELTEKLRMEDYRYAGLSKRLSVFYWIVAPLYMATMVAHVVGGSGVKDIVGSVCLLLGMLVFALLFRYYAKEYGSVDYSLPTLAMLKKAAYRYKPFQKVTWWVILALLLIDAGLSLNTSIGGGLVYKQIVFLGLMTLSVAGGLIWWRIRYKPLRDSALGLIKEIEGA